MRKNCMKLYKKLCKVCKNILIHILGLRVVFKLRVVLIRGKY